MVLLKFINQYFTNIQGLLGGAQHPFELLLNYSSSGSDFVALKIFAFRTNKMFSLDYLATLFYILLLLLELKCGYHKMQFNWVNNDQE